MTSIRILLFIFALLANVGAGNAATNSVVLGDNFQEIINSAANGDTLVVENGSYPGDLNFTKPLVIACSGTNGLEFPGTITISTTGRLAFAKAAFLQGFQVQTNATVVLSQSSSLGLLAFQKGGTFQAFDSRLAGATGNGGNWVIKRTLFSGNITLNNTALEALRMTNSAAVNFAAPLDSGTGVTAVQSSFYDFLVTGATLSFGYSSASSLLLTDAQATLVGAKVGFGGRNNNYILYSLRSDVTVYNSLFFRHVELDGGATPTVSLSSSKGKFVNCTIFSQGGRIAGAIDVYGLNFGANAGPLLIRNCILESHSNIGTGYCLASDGSPGVEVNHCAINGIIFGMTALNTLGSVGGLNSDFELEANSLCRNSGSPEAIYNDRDGTRNDIGMTGGPLWNPANYTNNNPIVYWSMPPTQTVVKGRDNSIKVSVGAAAGH